MFAMFIYLSCLATCLAPDEIGMCAVLFIYLVWSPVWHLTRLVFLLCLSCLVTCLAPEKIGVFAVFIYLSCLVTCLAPEKIGVFAVFI